MPPLPTRKTTHVEQAIARLTGAYRRTRADETPPFDPLSMGWEIYCDDTSLVDSGGYVGAWSDLSGHSRDLVEATTRPIFHASDAAFGGRACAEWTGTERLTSPSFASGSFTLFIVCTGLSTETAYLASRYGGSGQVDYLYGNYNYSSYVSRGGVQSLVNAPAAWGAFGATPKVVVVTYDGADVGAHKVIVNGSVVSSASIGSANATQESAALGLGLSLAWGSYATFKVAAVGWRNSALPAEDIATLTAALRDRYGI